MLPLALLNFSLSWVFPSWGQSFYKARMSLIVSKQTAFCFGFMMNHKNILSFPQNYLLWIHCTDVWSYIKMSHRYKGAVLRSGDRQKSCSPQYCTGRSPLRCQSQVLMPNLRRGILACCHLSWHPHGRHVRPRRALRIHSCETALNSLLGPEDGIFSLFLI